MLNRVTFTGADESISPELLIDVSRRFPFVEWGILIGSRQSVARMPSLKWIVQLLSLKAKEGEAVNLSLHVCGLPLRQIAAGRPIIGEGAESFAGFDRVQLNWHGDRQGDIGLNVATAFNHMRNFLGGWEPEVIFQGDETNVGAGLHRETENAGFRVSMLFDCSHGAGVLPGKWPTSIPSIKCGYAGGLGPGNVLEQLALIRQAYAAGATLHPYWVDMETKVRDRDDAFDLGKCLQVAQSVEALVWDEESP